jgi:DNA-binding NtrC family response regulator
MAKPEYILIVDDDLGYRKTLHDILKLKGFAPASFASGQEAMQAVMVDAPTVALIDLSLKDVTGLEVMRAIKARFPSTPCIVFTGYPSPDLASQAIAQGAHSFIYKPFEIEDLLQTIQQAIELSSEETA